MSSQEFHEYPIMCTFARVSHLYSFLLPKLFYLSGKLAIRIALSSAATIYWGLDPPSIWISSDFNWHLDNLYHRIWVTFLFSLKEFLPLSFMKVRNVEKKIFSEHRSLMGTSEIDSKYKYVKLARGLPTFGVHFFLAKVSLYIWTSTLMAEEAIFLNVSLLLWQL